ncbi:hypothetical protein BCR43DRAFT_435414 [Syncephalastrum racemosum]|uniref:Uncharacterized protein n=1 Tax=Syncephalastrum racemosum TaxID=13706 RepID=A0A1X2HJH6_SYNRA|nr:hypothetical protein BCR43DRAFT_435414 [Syncephalastrum racemosum]
MTQDESIPQAHLFPFGSVQEGPTNAKQYLQIQPSTHLDHLHPGKKTYQTLLHGRQLYGRHHDIGSRQGHVWRQLDEDENTLQKTNTQVQTFVLWKKDNAPEQDARIDALTHWLDIADAIHEPIPTH